MGYDNAPLAAKPNQTAMAIRLAAPKSIQPLRRHRLTPYPTLCALLEAYLSCSQPLLYLIKLNYK